MVYGERLTTCLILQRSSLEIFSLRNNSYRFVYNYRSFINLQKARSEGLECKTVSPQGAFRVLGIDISREILLRREKTPLLLRRNGDDEIGNFTKT